MTLGVSRSVGFDYGGEGDRDGVGGDGGGKNVDIPWEQCKRLPSSQPAVCTLNTHCADVPEMWTDAVASEEASCGDRAEEKGIQGAHEAESVVEYVESPRLGWKCGGQGSRLKKPDTVNSSANEEGLTSCDIRQPQSLTPLGAPEADGSEVPKNPCFVAYGVDDKSELGVVELSNKATETQNSSTSCIPAKGQNQDLALHVRSKKSPSDAAPRGFPQLWKYTAHTKDPNLTVNIPDLLMSPRTPTPCQFAPSDNLESDACEEQSMGSKSLCPPEFAEKERSPGYSAILEFGGAGVCSLTSSRESRSMEEHNIVSQRQYFRQAKKNHQGNKRKLSVVLALPHFSSHQRTSHNMEFLNESSDGACKANSLRSQASEPIILLDKVRSCESTLETLNCSGEGKLTKKHVKFLGRHPAQQLVKKTIRGNAYEPSVSSELKGSLTTQKEALETVEGMRYSNKLEESSESWQSWILGNMTGESGFLEDSSNESEDQSSRLAEDTDFHSGCDLLQKFSKCMPIAKTKVLQASSSCPTWGIISRQGPLDIAGVSKEVGPSIIPKIKNFVKKKVVENKVIVTRKMVKETLRLFQAICRKLLREEESKARQSCYNNRVDLMALNLIKENGKCLNAGEHHFGSVPGVEIGDEFHYRAELSIIGLHRNIMAGINYSKHDGLYITSSIVFYESYFDFLERSDVLLYTGPSGKPSSCYQNKNENHIRNEKPERGNLALKNNMDVQIPVRVVLGLNGPKDSNCRSSKAKGSVTYVYDGLYLVEKYWPEMGNHGVSVFKFQLRRMPGQRQLAIKEIQNSKGFRLQQCLHMGDISHGRESIAVSLVNTIDDGQPLPFRYINKVVYPSWHNMISPKGCGCTDGCSDSLNCACAVKNGGEIPFNYDGAIVEAKPLVYECGPSCKCPPSCHNRVSQHGIKYPLQIFKTESMGWGVRSLTSIPSGSFICEYIGEMIEESEANKRTDDDYLFDIGQNYHDDAIWEGLSTCIPGLQQDASCEVVEDDWFTIDAANYGNIGRFINHCCTPNLYAQNVLYDHDDKRMPHIMFFAAENISPLEELTYHYNYTIDQVRDADGNIKKKNCYCGSVGCTGRLY